MTALRPKHPSSAASAHARRRGDRCDGAGTQHDYVRQVRVYATFLEGSLDTVTARMSGASSFTSTGMVPASPPPGPQCHPRSPRALNACTVQNQLYCWVVIPRLVTEVGHSAQILPVGLHYVSLREFRDVFAFNPYRAWLFEGLKAACHDLRVAGCARIFIGGSYVTSKPDPGDYDACWDPVGVSADLDTILYDENMLLERRQRYRGDLLIGGCAPGSSGEFFRFLARDKVSGEERGMIGIKLKLLEIMNS